MRRQPLRPRPGLLRLLLTSADPNPAPPGRPSLRRLCSLAGAVLSDGRCCAPSPPRLAGGGQGGGGEGGVAHGR
eukprot:7260794-Prymnesium_polylepis.1